MKTKDDTTMKSLSRELDEARGLAIKLREALSDTHMICLMRGEGLGLDSGGPVMDKAREALEVAKGVLGEA